jgi:hypothetical protein
MRIRSGALWLGASSLAIQEQTNPEANQRLASWTVRAMSRRLDIQAWTHPEQRKPETIVLAFYI